MSSMCVGSWGVLHFWFHALDRSFDFILISKWLREMEVLSCVLSTDHTYKFINSEVFLRVDKIVPSSEDIN
jgi:hypothetical protein